MRRRSNNVRYPIRGRAPRSRFGLQLLLAGFAFLLVRMALGQPAERPGVQVITAEHIEQAGLTRLSDLFSLIDDWHAVSIEGFSWDVAPNGLSPYQESSWVVLVDGHPVDVSILDEQNLNILPVALSQIAYVEVYHRPAFVGGVFSQTGVLHLHTRAPAKGGTVQGRFAAGNETGDPGPFKYTDFATPNIDRIGPTLHATTSVAGPTWHARASLIDDEHHATDEHIHRRVMDWYQGEKAPRYILTSAGLNLATTRRAGMHHLFSGFTRLQDLPFYAPLGREAPRDHRLYHAGLRGDFAPDRPTGVSYRLSYTVSDLDPRQNATRLDFDWRQDRLRGHYEVRAGTPTTGASLGLSIDHVKNFTAYPLRTRSLTIPYAYTQLRRAGGHTRQYAAAYVTRVDGRRGFGGIVSLEVRPVPAHTFALVGSVARRPAAELHRWWYWLREGYHFLTDRDASVVLPNSFEASTTYTADVSWTFEPDDRFGVTLAGAYRRFDDLMLASYTFDFDSLTTGFVTHTVVRNNVFGRVTKGSVRVRTRVWPWLEQQIYYAYLRYPTTDEAFYKAWRSQPWHTFSYTARLMPSPRMSLFGRLAYTSETEWPAFHRAARDSGTLYTARLPGFWILDVTAQKRFWDDHLRGVLSLRNFLNEPYRLHPAGAVTRIVFHVGLELSLNWQRGET